MEHGIFIWTLRMREINDQIITNDELEIVTDDELEIDDKMDRLYSF